jgi:exonuclease III
MDSGLRLVAYNFLVGGSAKRPGHWSRLLRTLSPDIVFGQECRPPEQTPGETFRPGPRDTFVWSSAGSSRWGSGLLLRGAELARIPVPQFDGWVVGGEIRSAAWSPQPLRVFSVHTPVGEHGYVRTVHEILDRIARLRGTAELVLAGDFNVAVGDRPAKGHRPLRRNRLTLLERLAEELGLISCWQTAHPGRPLAQTLRWSANPTTPYHCDGIFVPRTWSSRLSACRVVRGSRWDRMSDHSPVLAEIEVLGSP